jgi:hypothetical protein
MENLKTKIPGSKKSKFQNQGSNDAPSLANDPRVMACNLLPQYARNGIRKQPWDHLPPSTTCIYEFTSKYRESTERERVFDHSSGSSTVHAGS